MKYIFLIIISTLIMNLNLEAKELNAKKEINWTFTRQLSQGPRGGSSVGVAVVLDEKVPLAWSKLKETNITKYERDRRAIYALEGTYKVSFEFLETYTFGLNKKLDQPYFSWATEFVKVIEDNGDFISLQHIMVMNYKDIKTGKESGPIVMKHWRQDWTWQANSQLKYIGKKTWENQMLSQEETKGKWLWEVFQVDDSPRYSGLGTWGHLSGASVFDTGYMARPLPRREHSVRSDYSILLGKDNLVVTPHSWFHEQKSFKEKTVGLAKSFLAREVGQNSYKRIKGFNFKPGEVYWSQSSSYWADVRFVWKDLISKNKKFSLRKSVNGKPLFQYHFEQAADESVLSMPPAKRRSLVELTIKKFIK